ncbi:unnamed protein product [Medioppia subpectinata]|uniref:Uncharacterized protein n=1 Tax=Medioppia subpectinata TaxID=1979941 RepID=A0A7R9PWZ8_9ACAR|nr:unnamed protein product [Medioppia subpectinata]CAG2104256.1 unnamed protein product [Medioppia subpectinata]
MSDGLDTHLHHSEDYYHRLAHIITNNQLNAHKAHIQTAIPPDLLPYREWFIERVESLADLSAADCHRLIHRRSRDHTKDLIKSDAKVKKMRQILAKMNGIEVNDNSLPFEETDDEECEDTIDKKNELIKVKAEVDQLDQMLAMIDVSIHEMPSVDELIASAKRLNDQLVSYRRDTQALSDEIARDQLTAMAIEADIFKIYKNNPNLI